jgi:hypothetical protein
LEAAAEKGNEDAQKELQGPPLPPCVAYLYEWAMGLFGRSGIGMEGVAPLTFTTIESWARLTDRNLEPHEVEALLEIDLAMRPDMRPEPEPEGTKQMSWPTGNNG